MAAPDAPGLKEAVCTGVDGPITGPLAFLWLKPADGGSPITRYDFRFWLASKAFPPLIWTTLTNDGNAAQATTDKALAVSFAWQRALAQVRAVNADGIGAASNTVIVQRHMAWMSYNPAFIPINGARLNKESRDILRGRYENVIPGMAEWCESYAPNAPGDVKRDACLLAVAYLVDTMTQRGQRIGRAAERPYEPRASAESAEVPAPEPIQSGPPPNAGNVYRRSGALAMLSPYRQRRII